MGLLLLDSSAIPPVARPAEVYASMLRSLLPPGKLWRVAGSVLSKLFLGCADELARIDIRTGDLRNEADPTTALELLPEHELDLDLEAGSGSIDERRARVVARRVSRQRFRPVDFQTALASLLALDPSDVVIVEHTRAFCLAIGDDREIFRFFVYRDPTLPGTYFLDSAQEMLDEIDPSHTVGQVIESIDFAYDDPFSLYDRDLLGPVPIFVAAGTAVTSRAATITLATPAGVVPGDTLLLLAFSGDISQSDLTTGSLPSGWSLLSRIDINDGTPRVSVLARRAVVPGEPASHVFPMTATGAGAPVLGVIVAYRHLDNTADLVAASAVTVVNATSFPCPSLTMPATNDVYLGWAPTNNNTASATCPDGSIERVDQGAAQSGFNRAVVFDLDLSTGGSTGTQTVTMSTSVTGMAAAYALRAKVGA